MITTIIGKLADKDGLYQQLSLRQGRHGPELVRSFGCAPGTEYRSRQRPDLPLELGHTRTIGHCRHLERNAGNVWVVAEVTARPATIPSGCVYLSPTFDRTRNGTDVDLVSVSLVDDPASIGALPVHELVGDLREACRQSWRLRNRWLSEVLERARDSKVGTSTIYERHPAPTVDLRTGGWVDHRGEPLRIQGRSSGKLIRLPDGSYGEMEYLHAGYILGVR